MTTLDYVLRVVGTATGYKAPGEAVTRKDAVTAHLQVPSRRSLGNTEENHNLTAAKSATEVRNKHLPNASQSIAGSNILQRLETLRPGSWRLHLWLAVGAVGCATPPTCVTDFSSPEGRTAFRVASFIISLRIIAASFLL